MDVLAALKMSGFAYLVLIIIAFMVAGLIQGMNLFLKKKPNHKP